LFHLQAFEKLVKNENKVMRQTSKKIPNTFTIPCSGNVAAHALHTELLALVNVIPIAENQGLGRLRPESPVA
jgi:hypothetical protein